MTASPTPDHNRLNLDLLNLKVSFVNNEEHRKMVALLISDDPKVADPAREALRAILASPFIHELERQARAQLAQPSMPTPPIPDLRAVDLSDVDIHADLPIITDRYRVAVDAYWRKTGLPCGSSLQWRPASHTWGVKPWRSDWGPVDASATGLDWASYDYRVQPPRKAVWWRGPQDVIDLGVRYTRNGDYIGQGYALTPTGMWFNVNGGSAFARWGTDDMRSFEWSSDRHTWKACTVEVRS